MRLELTDTNVLMRAAAELTPHDKILRVADRYRPAFVEMFMGSVNQARANIDVVTLEMLFMLGEPAAIETYLERAILDTEVPFRIAVKTKASELILDVNEDAGNATRCDWLPDAPATYRGAKQGYHCFYEFDRVNPLAVAAAEAHAAEMVTAVSAETRAAIKEIIVRMFNEGIPPRQAAPMIKNLVGLTRAQANAVVNLHQKILTSPGAKLYAGKTPIRVPPGGMPAEQLDKVLSKYADRLTRQRAMNIARTETIKAANDGQVELWRQAQQRGELAPNLRHEWIADETERTCLICSAANGEIVPLGEQFSTGVTQPPAHPSCRCSTGLVL